MNEDWVDQRLYLFERFFIGSLLHQTETNFDVVLLIRENFEYCVKQFSELVSKYKPWLHIQLVEKQANLYPLAPKLLRKRCEKYDWVYYTRCDTDDFFSKYAVEKIQEQEPDIRTAITFQQGFNYHLPDYRLACWGSREAPNYTIIFPTEIFLRERPAHEYGMCKHRQVKQLFKRIRLDKWQYCIMTHNKSTSTRASGHPLRTISSCDTFFDNFPVMRVFASITLVRTSGRRKIVPYSELETYYAQRTDSAADP